MRHISREVEKVLSKFTHYPCLTVEDGSKHAKVRNVFSRDWLPLPGSTSDRRGIHNLESCLKRLAITGKGFIYAKTGRSPKS